MDSIVVFADVVCPFAHVGLTRIAAYRSLLGPGAPPIRVRSWPLELVNGAPLAGPTLAPKIAALQRDCVPDLFAGFDPARFPSTSIPALAAEASAYRAGDEAGLQCSLALRRALFEDGLDIGDPAVTTEVLRQLDLPAAEDGDLAAIAHDHAAGIERGVKGSPHFFTANDDFFCPTLEIRHDDDGYEMSFDAEHFEAFVTAAFA